MIAHVHRYVLPTVAPGGVFVGRCECGAERVWQPFNAKGYMVPRIRDGKGIERFTDISLTKEPGPRTIPVSAPAVNERRGRKVLHGKNAR